MMHTGMPKIPSLKIILETSYTLNFMNNISPSNIKYSVKSKKTLTGHFTLVNNFNLDSLAHGKYMPSQQT